MIPVSDCDMRIQLAIKLASAYNKARQTDHPVDFAELADIAINFIQNYEEKRLDHLCILGK